MIAVDDPRIIEFLRRWHAQRRARFESLGPSLDYDATDAKTAHDLDAVLRTATR